ncbi:MAG TPA: GTP-binding protein [Burkholderiales bacterium]|jgi:G3E family GTPase
MNPPLPAIFVAGFGGTGKHQVIEALLAQRPAAEQWALIAPAGLLGAARFSGAPADGVKMETVAPGCPCCTGLTPFSAGLVTLLRKLRDKPVTRLLIEGGSEGHIESVARLLQQPQFSPHVFLAHALAVIDPAWLANPSAAAQEALAGLAGAADSLVAAPWNENAPARSEFRDFAGRFAPSRPWTALEGVRLEADFVQAVLSTQTFQGTR